MTNPIKKAAISTKDFVVSHKTAILATIAATAISAVVVEKRALDLHNDFLKEKDLYDEFYAEPLQAIEQ